MNLSTKRTGQSIFRSVSKPYIKRIHILWLMCALALSFITTRSQLAEQTKPFEQRPDERAALEDRIGVKALGRGNPLVSLSDGRTLRTSYIGDDILKLEFELNRARPLALASADFDEDGVPDLVSGYTCSRGGVIALHRGNVDSIYPNSPDAQLRKARGQFTGEAFLPDARLSALSCSPDFLAAGDFDADGRFDIVAATRGSDSLCLMAGDGKGSFAAPEQIKLAGRVTALAAGEVNRRDGLTDLVIGVVAKHGAQALVFEGPDGALRASPEQFDLPVEASSLALGQLDDEYEMDFAVAAGRELLIVQGRDRKLSLAKSERDKVGPASISRHLQTTAIRAVTVGDFTGNSRTDIALLFEGGAVEVLSRAASQSESDGGWNSESVGGAQWPLGAGLLSARVSSSPGDDLIVIDRSAERLEIVTGGKAEAGEAGISSIDVRHKKVVSLDVEGGLAAVLPMRLNADARNDLVVLTSTHSVPTVVATTTAMTFTVTNTSNSGAGSLRQAILDANANAGADTINFQIGTGTQTIAPLSELPGITSPVTIDGTTQPGFAGTPIIELSGANTGIFTRGLSIRVGGCVVRGLVINRFDSDGIDLGFGSSSSIIEGNFIGTDINGVTAFGNGEGISNTTANANNLIGGTTPQARNVISGNDGGIQIFGSFNQVQGNFIGTDATGTAALPNVFGGVSITGDNNTIGGTVANAGNVISGNNLSGIRITFVEGNLVQANLVGTNATGTAAIANTSGVNISAANDNTVGGTTITARNILSGNGFEGVVISSDSATDNLVQGNFIGTDINGTSDLGNRIYGVSLILTAVENTVGGATDSARNIISGNDVAGISMGEVDNAITINNVIEGNFIGTDVSGMGDLGNDGEGVLFPANADGSRIENNRIAFNSFAGICIPDVTGDNTPGIRISIQDNSVFSNGNIGIDLGPTGLTPNDSKDPDAGPNTLQNFPLLTSVTSSGGTTHIVGNLNSTPNSDFFVQFFSSNQCSGSNPRGDQQILTLPILFHTNGNGDAPIDLTITVTPSGGWVNCIATNSTGNSSEFSPCVQINQSACSFSISPASGSFESSGGTGTVSVTTAAGCNWLAASNVTWINITSGSSGTGNGSVGYSVAANSNASPRIGTMTIAGQTFTLTQEGQQECTTTPIIRGQMVSQSLSASDCRSQIRGNTTFADRYSFDGAAGEQIAIELNSSAFDTYLYLFGPSGSLVAQDDDGGSGANSRIPVNSGFFTLPASGTYIVEATSFFSNSSGNYTLLLTGLVCSYSLSPASQSFTAPGGSGSFNIIAQSGCNWSASSNDFWVQVTGGNFGSGNGTVFYSVQANSSTAARSGTISIADTQFTIEQEGLNCGFNIRPTRQAFSITGGESSFTVMAAAGCNWLASSFDSWITVETAGGSGNGAVNFIVRDNFTGRFRTGSITVADQLFTVNQDGGEAENCNYGITPTFQSFSASGGTGSLTVITGEECIWEAVSNVVWVTITSDNNGLGVGTITFTVGANAGAGGRKGTITVGGKSFSVKQKGSG